MGKFNYNPEDLNKKEEKTGKREMHHGRCEVHGCNRNGHIYTTNWNCRYHYAKSGDSLSRITLIMNNHKADFDWYEKVTNYCAVDFALGIVAINAPHTLEVNEGEKFHEYRERMRNNVESLLINREPIPRTAPIMDRKSIASGERDEF